jgi:hypothetical protein
MRSDKQLSWGTIDKYWVGIERRELEPSGLRLSQTKLSAVFELDFP